MLENILTVGQQVIILFILIAVGFICGKTKLITEEGSKCLNELVLYVVTPCVIIKSFIRPFDSSMLTNILLAAALAIVIHVVSIGIAMLIFRDKNIARKRVYRFSVIFSNCAFMSLPLQQAVLGDDGVFYAAVYIAVFNLVLWSYGVVMMSGDKKFLSAKKILLNPGIVGVFVGIIIFVCNIQIPEIIFEPISYIAALNTPVPMIFIGYYLSKSNILDAFKDAKSYAAIALRLVLIPLITFGTLYLCGIRGTLLVSCVISASAPAAATTTMFAAKFNQDAPLAVNLVTLSTLCSVITMPIIVGFTQLIA